MYRISVPALHIITLRMSGQAQGCSKQASQCILMPVVHQHTLKNVGLSSLPFWSINVFLSLSWTSAVIVPS